MTYSNSQGLGGLGLLTFVRRKCVGARLRHMKSWDDKEWEGLKKFETRIGLFTSVIFIYFLTYIGSPPFFHHLKMRDMLSPCRTHPLTTHTCLKQGS
jgi:hypothetical protein